MRQAMGVFAATCLLLLGTTAEAQQIPNWVFGSGGGESSQGPNRHFSATGLGMGVGRSEGGGYVVYHGYLAGAAAVRDDVPPVIDVPDDLDVTTQADACSALVNLPAVQVTDNRDRAPRVQVTLQSNPPQDIDPAGEEVRLEIGTYDVLIVATDKYGNESRASYRIDVEDRTPPQLIPVPNPTPVGQEAEASSPIGTPVNLRYNCIDACDPNPVAAQQPALVRYPVGDTNVAVMCRDSIGNEARHNVTVRVRDTRPPTLAAALPDDVDAECNRAGGAIYPVPRLVWQDNGTNAQDLRFSLIVDPDGANQVHDPLPGEVVLGRGRHVLRYVAVDAAGNSGTADLEVNIIDEGVPLIEVLAAPENGWHGGVEDVQVVLSISDGCSDLQNELDIDIVPPPTAMAVEGNRVTLTYRAEGRYRLAIHVEDEDGNEASDNTVGFGIDRGAPQPVIRVPSQTGVVSEDRLTWPIFARDQRLALNFGGEDESDGTPSGIANVTVILDPDDPNENRLVADHDFDGAGNPPQGQRVVAGVACENMVRGNVGGVPVRDRYCSFDLELDLREVPKGAHVLEVTVTDFAGNSSTTTAHFINADLNSGAVELIARLGDLIQNGDPGAARGNLVGASQQLTRVRDLSALAIQGSTYRTPRFLGAALAAAQLATLQLIDALDRADGALAARIEDALETLQRLGRGDVVLMQAYTASLERRNRPAFLTEAYETDVELLDLSLASIDRALGTGQWSQAATDVVGAFFFAKSAYSEWMMDYDYVPHPAQRDLVTAEYARGRDILVGIRDELNAYLTLPSPPAEVQMRRIRDRLNTVVDRLNTLVTSGFQGPGGGAGLSDASYLDALVELREVANVSTEAGNRGAWVRNYQWPMMQVIRFMTQASVEDAIASFGGGRVNWPIYLLSRELIDEGVALLDERRVQEVIDLYGLDEDAVCLVTAVYHCDYIRDEGPGDLDDPRPDDDVEPFCWDKMWRPGEWPMVPAANGVIAQCQYAPAGNLRP